MDEKINDLRIFKGTAQGTEDQKKSDRAMTFSVIAAVVSIVAILYNILRP